MSQSDSRVWLGFRRLREEWSDAEGGYYYPDWTPPKVRRWHRWMIQAHDLEHSKHITVACFVTARRCDHLVHQLIDARLAKGDRYPLYTREPAR